uniref:Diacylglycerol O-acyltransferase n=1 Tax=Chenopodium quinoa TaxID=63459 RepID=A0A803KZN1_CHEQI
MELLSPASVAFHKPDFNIHVMAIFGVKTPVDIELLKAKFPTSLCKHPRFSSLVEGDPSKGEELKWVRTEINLDKHIIAPKINSEDIKSPDKYVEDYIYNLSKTTLDKSRPLWDIHVLNLKLSEEVEAITITRIHHSLGDGTSLISLLLALTRKTSDPEALPTIPAPKIKRDDDNRKGIFWRWILALWLILKLFWNTSMDVLMFVATTLFLKDNSPFKTSPNGGNVSRRVVYKSFSLQDMKFVKNAIGATINDVALGITQAGLSRYLSRKYDAEAKWGNAVGYVLLPFALGLHDDPLDYIRTAKTTVDKKKHSLEAIYTFFMAEVVMKFFGSKVASVISDRINSHTTIAFSNLPGPLEEIGFYGLPLTFLAPTSYGQPHPVMINFLSYSNKMTVVLAVDEYTVPDPHQLCDDIAESLNLIKDAVITQGLVKQDHSVM